MSSGQYDLPFGRRKCSHCACSPFLPCKFFAYKISKHERNKFENRIAFIFFPPRGKRNWCKSLAWPLVVLQAWGVENVGRKTRLQIRSCNVGQFFLSSSLLPPIRFSTKINAVSRYIFSSRMNAFFESRSLFLFKLHWL